jgi:DNA-binding response OmpR family regulator
MTHQTVPQILIVDDDECICKTLSAILQSEGYQTTIATTAKEAIEKSKTQFFNLALLDIKLPDMKGTQLLSQLQEITLETIKIMITGYPSLENAVEALNFGADSYIMKPIDPAELIKTIKNKLETQKQTEKITKEKLAAWIQSQARKAQTSNFQEFLEETASELAHFGLTKTQAKIYITLIALGVASASEIAALSKIRREEVYRIIPEMEKHGIITRKLKAPRKFSAIQPETAFQLLTKTKLKTMTEEIDKLRQKQAELISRLKTIELPTQRNKCSIDVISKQHNLFLKLIDTTQNAKRQIDAIVSLENLEYAYLNYPKNLKERLAKAIKIRVITESHEPDAFTKEIIRYSEANNNRIELRQAEKVPFNLTIVDDNEAIWGGLQPKNKNTQDLWTNDPTQITILKTSFESLWQKSSSIRTTKKRQKVGSQK